MWAQKSVLHCDWDLILTRLLSKRCARRRNESESPPRLLACCWDRSVPCSHNFCGQVWILKRLQYVYIITLSMRFETWVSFTVGYATQLCAAISRSPPSYSRRADRPSDSWFIHSRDTINLITRTLKQSKVWWVIGCVSLTRLMFHHILASNRCRLPRQACDYSFRRFTNNIL